MGFEKLCIAVFNGIEKLCMGVIMVFGKLFNELMFGCNIEK